MRRRSWRWMIALAVLSLAAPVAAQSPSGGAGQAPSDEAAKTAARSLAETGKKRFDSGDYAGALEALRDAEKYFRAPTITHLRARAHEKLGQLIEARDLDGELVKEQLPADAPSEFWEAKEASKKSLESLEKRIPTIQVTILHAPAGADATLDGKLIEPAALGQPIQVNPGKHTVAVASQSGMSTNRVLNLSEGAREKVELDLAPLPPVPSATPGAAPPLPASAGPKQPAGAGLTPAPAIPYRGVPVATYVAYGVGAVGLVTGAVLGGLAFGKRDEFNKNPTIEVSDQGEAFALQADIAFSVAAIAAIAGTVVWLRPPLEDKPASASRGVYVAPALGGLTMGGRF